MTERQRIFCDEYLIDCNATRAYKVAYPRIKNDNVAKSAGNRMLTFVDVKTYIDEKLEEISSKKIANAKEVLEYLTAIMRGEMKEEVFRIDTNGVQVREYITVSCRERVKAAELLGKYYSLFTERMRVDATNQVVIVDDIPRGDKNA